MHNIAPILFLMLMTTILACAILDRFKRRAIAPFQPLTVIVPCFNDGATVAATLRSIFASWPGELLDVIAIDDASKDDSLARIHEVAAQHPVRVIAHPRNLGKSEALNRAVREARHATILFVDADTLLTPGAAGDMNTRLAHDSRVGAVSCPYAPVNRGFLPALQAVEYSMLRIGQGAGNVTSALALWGGCLMIRRAALDAVAGFSRNAITEDVDLAFKLNSKGWRVEQSFVFVQTSVPTTWRVWMRQKVRWTSGGFQCAFRYPGVWLTNPVQMMFICAYAVLTVLGLFNMAADASWIAIGSRVADLWAADVPMAALWSMTWLTHGPVLMAKLLTMAGLGLVSLVYVLPTIARLQDWMRIALVLPFSIGYFPLYLLVSVVGFCLWFFSLRKCGTEARAW